MQTVAGSGTVSGGSGRDRIVRLHVLSPEVQHAERRLLRRRRFRAAALIAVYVLMIAHVAHWAITGRSVAPFVFSEAMKTLELGQINPGFLLFAVALLATLVFGRFLCGWACHMAGLQDLCAWLLRKMGVRPRLFQARLLGYVPLVLALYMFVWPTAKREVILPVLGKVWPGATAWLAPVPPFPGWSLNLMTEHLWDGLPSAGVTVAFLLVCGFATVYFLGARGLCRYGCPYGGFFLPAEQLAPGRVVVNADLCDGCGRCTAACTSGVRVLEETRDFGTVIDRNCVRSLDCIAACPRDALSFSLARPPVLMGSSRGQRPKRAYDVTMGEEVMLLGVFLVTLTATRGLYDLIPLLMAVSIAALAAFVVWRALRLLRSRDGRFVGVQLKRSGTLQPGGVVFLAAAVLCAALVVHSSLVRAALWRAGSLDNLVMTTREEVFDGASAGIRESDREHAQAALWWYGLAASMWRGGIGLAESPEILPRQAWLSLVLGDLERAEASFQLVAERDRHDALFADLARIRLLRGDELGAIAGLEEACRRRSNLQESRGVLVLLLAQGGAWDRAEAAARDGVVEAGNPMADKLLGWVLLSRGDAKAALAPLERCGDAMPDDPMTLDMLASTHAALGDVDRALDRLARLARAGEQAFGYAFSRGEALLTAVGRGAEVDEWWRRLSSPHGVPPAQR